MSAAATLRIERGLDGIAITETRLSRVDGDAGELVLGGFPIEELAPHATFEEVLFLLWHDRLPAPDELSELRARLAECRRLSDATLDLLASAAAAEVAPMDALAMGVASLGIAATDLARMELSGEPPAENLDRAVRLVAAVPAPPMLPRLALGLVGLMTARRR